MHIHFCFVLILIAIHSQAQNKLDSYKASNGVSYHEGDTLKIGRGTMPNGDFKYFEMTGFNAVLTHNHANAANMPKRISGYNLVIKKIRKSPSNGADKVEFVVSGAGPATFKVYVEDAISTCEILPCADKSATSNDAPVEDKYDKLKKLKSLLDSGAITQEEYDTQKKKILDEQ